MPVNRAAPRPHSARLYHRPLERLRLYGTLVDLRRMWTLVRVACPTPARRQRMRVRILHLFGLVMRLMWAPRVTDCPAQPRRHHSHFTDDNFLSHFRFRKQDFFRVLSAMGLTDAAGSPVWLRVGSEGKHCVVPSDWALMVLLKRLATGATYRDMMCVVGGGKTALSNTFLHMLEMLFVKYRARLASLTFFRPHITAFMRLMHDLCRRLHGIACPFDGLVGVVDGKLYVTNRPTGPACRRPNMRDTDAFNGKARLHGLKYQGITTPVGLCVLEGPHGGAGSVSRCTPAWCWL